MCIRDRNLPAAACGFSATASRSLLLHALACVGAKCGKRAPPGRRDPRRKTGGTGSDDGRPTAK
eukprot:5086965-Alexandrium_andersonii.AAC.1